MSSYLFVCAFPLSFCPFIYRSSTCLRVASSIKRQFVCQTRDRDDNDTLDTVRKLKQGTRLSWGFASVADLIDYKLVQNSRPAFIPQEFRIHDLPLSHGARRIASAQPCFSADKLNRPFYLGPCYILTDPRGFSCFLFSFFPAHFIRTVTLRSLI